MVISLILAYNLIQLLVFAQADLNTMKTNQVPLFRMEFSLFDFTRLLILFLRGPLLRHADLIFISLEF